MNAANLFEIQHTSDYSLVRFFGSVDAAKVEKLKPVLEEQIPKTCNQLIIDLEQVEFLDSHGVGLFVSLLKKMHGKKGKLVIAGSEGQPASVLQMVGFNNTLVSFCANSNEAQALCKATNA